MKIEEWLQNRIIGAIVITLLAVIFLPMFLDDAEESLQETETLVLPEESLVNTMGLSTTELPDNVDDVIENLHAQPPEEITEPLPPAATTVPVPNPSTVAVPTTVMTVPTPAAVEKKSTTIKGWYVQAASFHREDNAYTLTEKLKSQGFSAVVDVSTSSSGTSIYRVRVAQADRQTAKNAKAKINQLNRLKSIIVFSN